MDLDRRHPPPKARKKIANLETYNQKMSASLDDKLFFLDHVSDFDLLVDFGCGDGSLIHAVAEDYRYRAYAGFDRSNEMLSLAVRKNAGANASFTCEWELIQDVLPAFDDPLLVLSSVVHEIYSYGTPEKIADFWDMVRTSGFRYVAIRDMAVSQELSRQQSDWEEVILVRGRRPNQVADFEERWGSIENQENLTHFLLKYRYMENWERERNEDYLGCTVEMYDDLFSEFDVIYRDHSPLPFLQEQVRKDFGFTPATPTHLKLVIDLEGDFATKDHLIS